MMNLAFLSNTNLFRGIREEELQALLPCLNAHEKRFDKDEVIYRAGDTVSEIGLVESGSVNILVNFYWGGSHIWPRGSSLRRPMPPSPARSCWLTWWRRRNAKSCF